MNIWTRLLIVICFAHFACEPPLPAAPTRARSDASVHAPSVVRLRHSLQAIWNGAPLYQTPTAEEVHRYETIAQTIRPVNEEANTVPLREPRVTALLAGGQRLIHDAAPMSELWSDTAVRRMAGSRFGSQFPFQETAGLNQMGGVIAWDPLRQEVVIFTGASAEGATPDLAASYLIHEATHGVFWEAYLALCNWRPEEYVAILLTCSDVRLEEAFVSESIAFLNEAYWLDTRPGDEGLLLYSGEEPLRMALLARRHQPVEFARAMELYALQETGTIGQPCGPPVVFRGPRRGQYCLPIEAVDDPIMRMVARAR